MQAYTFYRLQDYAQAAISAKTCPKSVPSLTCSHSLYHLREATDAAQHCAQLAADTLNEEEELTNVWTNLLAVVLSEETPYVSTFGNESIRSTLSTICDHVLSSGDTEDPDLIGNAAMFQLLTNPQDHYPWQSLLSPQDSTLEWSRALWNGTIPPVIQNSDNPALEAIQKVHQALLIDNEDRRYPSQKSINPKWTPFQQRLWWYNRAVWTYRNGNLDVC